MKENPNFKVDLSKKGNPLPGTEQVKLLEIPLQHTLLKSRWSQL